jgi:hypothetical protein
MSRPAAIIRRARSKPTMGNTVVENAEISIIQVDPDLPIEPLERWYKHS